MQTKPRMRTPGPREFRLDVATHLTRCQRSAVRGASTGNCVTCCFHSDARLSETTGCIRFGLKPPAGGNHEVAMENGAVAWGLRISDSC